MARQRARVAKRRPPHLLLIGEKRDYEAALAAAGYRLTTVPSIKEALRSRSRPDAVILELVVPEANLAGLADAMTSARRTRAMTVIALGAEENKRSAVEAGATFCRFPCPPEELVRFVQKTLALVGGRRSAGTSVTEGRPGI